MSVEEHNMSKFFFKGRPDVMGKYGKAGYSPKPNIKLGTAENPISITVQTEKREQEIIAILSENNLVGTVVIDDTAEENILDLEGALNKPTTQRFEKVPERNAPCSCGSGKKYKKCCG